MIDYSERVATPPAEELPVVDLGEVSYSVDDPDDAWIQAPVDCSPEQLNVALQAARLHGMELIPFEDAVPAFLDLDGIRYHRIYLQEVM